MDAQQVYNDIQKLPLMAGGIRQKETTAIKFLQNLYYQVTGSTVYAGCKGCHIKAANYLSSLTLQTLLIMSEQKFRLNKDVKIEWPFRSGQLLTEVNLTDAKAAEYLINNPAGLSNFVDYPKGQDGLDLSEWYPSDIHEAPAEEAPKRGRKGKVEEEAPAEEIQDEQDAE